MPPRNSATAKGSFWERKYQILAGPMLLTISFSHPMQKRMSWKMYSSNAFRCKYSVETSWWFAVDVDGKPQCQRGLLIGGVTDSPSPALSSISPTNTVATECLKTTKCRVRHRNGYNALRYIRHWKLPQEFTLETTGTARKQHQSFEFGQPLHVLVQQ